MSIKYQKVFLKELSYISSIRLSIPFTHSSTDHSLMKLIDAIETIESGSRPKGGIVNIDEGALSLGGEQINPLGYVDLSNMPLVSYEFYNTAAKGKVNKNDILINKDGALTGKVCIVDTDLPVQEVMVNEHVFLIRSKEEVMNQRFLYYLIKSNFVQRQIKDLAYKKKGQPGLNGDHIKAIKIPSIEKTIQDDILNKTSVFEKSIISLSKEIKSPRDIINDVFSKEFSFDIRKFEQLKKIKYYNSSLCDFANNKDLRKSVKFHRESGVHVLNELKARTDKKIKHYLSEPIVLGVSISPKDYDEEGDSYYISMADIKNWKFESEEAKKVSNSYASKNSNKTVAKDDIIIARSGEGTIGKVALIDYDDIQGIFADFTMRIRLENYNPLFAYYYFTTDYFQYLIEINKKGLGNNTNIFPSQIQEFPMLDISLQRQQDIVDKIKDTLDKQENLKQKVLEQRNKIDEVIQNIISSI